MKGYYSKIESLQNQEPPDSFSFQPTNPTNADPSAEIDASDAPQYRRNCSSSTMTPSRQGSSLKKALSIRRTTSVNDRYCRIHRQHAVLPVDDGDYDDHDDNDAAEETDSCDTGSATKDKKVGKGGKRLLKACKRIFRF